MTLVRRRFIELLAGASALPFALPIANAQSYPGRPVRIVSGFPPGGISDTYARLIAQWLSEHMNCAASSVANLGFKGTRDSICCQCRLDPEVRSAAS